MTTKLDIQERVFSQDWAGQNLEFRSGMLAPLSDGSVVVTLGGITLLATCVINKSPDENKDFMPLAVEFNEKFYAAGKLGGVAYTRREGRPSDIAVLTSRLTDRPIRPMFPEGMINDVVVNITALSTDRKSHPGVASIISASLSIMIAGIPFEGPIGAVRIGYVEDKLIVNPTYEQLDKSSLDLLIAGSADTITMVECGSNEIATDILLDAFELAQSEIQKVCQYQTEFLKQFDIETKEIKVNLPNKEVMDYISNIFTKDRLDRLYPVDKKTLSNFEHEITDEVLQSAKDKIEDKENKDFTESKLKIGVFKLMKKYIRENILTKDSRLDGRVLDQVRPLYAAVGVLPNVHGSAIFQRGETQVLAITTLGAPGDVLLLDSMEYDSKEVRFMHHYNMPPFATNEARMSRGTGRREIGHGKLAEKSLENMIPSAEDFPYTIRCVSEVLASNGSSSMASVCGTCLSLMDAGVQIKNPVSGIAMGLITDDVNYKILSDIQGMEDHCGDMDFKVAGTRNGITALQMDMKIKGLPLDILRKAILQANIGRLSILDFMLQTLSAPRPEMSPNAPKIIKYKVEVGQIKDVIGPGGAVIQDIVRQTGVKVDINDDGTCLITARDNESAEKALDMIKKVTWTPKTGDEMSGNITRVEQYGVFVNIGKNKQGLCHVKNLSEGFVSDPKTLYKEGDIINVKIIGIDNDGKIQLKKQ